MIGIAIAGSLLALYRTGFLYLAIYALVGLNFTFISPFLFVQSGRELVFTGQVVEQEPIQDQSRISIKLKCLVSPTSDRRCSLPVEISKSENIRLLGKEIVIKGRITGKSMSRRKYRFAGKIISVRENSSIFLSMIGRSRAFIESTFRRVFRNRIYENISSGMILGGINRLSTNDRLIFRDAGILHIMAVSGLHVGFVMLFVGALLFLIPFNRHMKVLLVCAVLLFYASLTGWRPSVFRATVMTMLFSLALISERNVKALHVVNVTALIFLIIDPLILFDLGAQLSFAAVYGIVILYPQFKVNYVDPRSNRLFRIILASFFVSLSAQLFVIPLTNYYFHRITPYGIISNVIIVPLASLIIFLLFILLITGAAWIGAGHVIAVPVRALLFMLVKISHFFSSLPYAGLAISFTPLAIPFIYLLFFPRLRKIGMLIILVLLIIKSIPFPLNVIAIRSSTAGTLLSFSYGVRVLINPSANSYALMQFLQNEGISSVDYVISDAKPELDYGCFISTPSEFVARSVKFGRTLIHIEKSITIFHGINRFALSVPEEGTVEYMIANDHEIRRYRATYNPSIPERIIDEIVLLILRWQLSLGL